MNIIERTENPLTSGTSVTDGLMISSIKKLSREKHGKLHFVVVYPEINSPALWGGVLR
ncbi:hypothetical protein [Candidatus Nitrotoga sp. BS]|uniref:hypothetical protein n=1 Tax=Candidatus Nitrotoga sp. BS TaxID=2890408 RepID=UPI001EF2AE2B|nr:hypothetical protein [Candidatus Nitrotoga sp. BS]